MFKIIPKTYAALPQEWIDEEVGKMQNKCKIDGKIIDVKYGEKVQYFQNIELIVQKGNDYYKFHSHKLYEECTFDTIYQVYFDIPKGKKQYFLSDKDYNVISNSLRDYEKYTTPKCESNYSQKEYIMGYGNFTQKVNYFFENNSYVIVGILLIFIVLVGITYKKIKSRN